MPNKKFIISLLLLLTTLLYTRVYYKPVSRAFASTEFKQQIENFPRQIGDWHYIKNLSMSKTAYNALNPQALVFREYANAAGEVIVLTIVYHENQRWGAHDVEVCYKSQGWSVIKNDGVSTQKIQLKGSGITANIMEVEKPEARSTVLFWWFSQGKKQMPDRINQMLSNAVSSLLYGNNASGLVRISGSGGEHGLAVLTNFTEQLSPVLNQYLP